MVGELKNPQPNYLPILDMHSPHLGMWKFLQWKQSMVSTCKIHHHYHFGDMLGVVYVLFYMHLLRIPIVYIEIFTLPINTTHYSLLLCASFFINLNNKFWFLLPSLNPKIFPPYKPQPTQTSSDRVAPFIYDLPRAKLLELCRHEGQTFTLLIQ